MGESGTAEDNVILSCAVLPLVKISPVVIRRDFCHFFGQYKLWCMLWQECEQIWDKMYFWVHVAFNYWWGHNSSQPLNLYSAPQTRLLWWPYRSTWLQTTKLSGFSETLKALHYAHGEAIYRCYNCLSRGNGQTIENGRNGIIVVKVVQIASTYLGVFTCRSSNTQLCWTKVKEDNWI